MNSEDRKRLEEIDRLLPRGVRTDGYHTCKCGWEGYGIEMIQRPFHEQDHPLAMRKGYLYLCPECEQVLSKETIALS